MVAIRLKQFSEWKSKSKSKSKRKSRSKRKSKSKKYRDTSINSNFNMQGNRV